MRSSQLPEERVVVISRAASGIGRELALAYAAKNAKLALIDRDSQKLELLAADLRNRGVRFSALIVNVSQREEIQHAFEAISTALGPVDVVVPCAGICRASTVDDLQVDELTKLMDINFLGTVHMIEAALPSMLARQKGHLVGFSCLAGVCGFLFEPSYSASKAAVAAYLESIRYELRSRGISVTTVFPGYVQTPLLDEINGRMGADMSNGRAYTGVAAAARILSAIERRERHLYFPFMLGLSVRLSRLLPPMMYDWVMGRMFSRLPIAQVRS